MARFQHLWTSLVVLSLACSAKEPAGEMSPDTSSTTSNSAPVATPSATVASSAPGTHSSASPSQVASQSPTTPAASSVVPSASASLSAPATAGSSVNSSPTSSTEPSATPTDDVTDNSSLPDDAQAGGGGNANDAGTPGGAGGAGGNGGMGGDPTPVTCTGDALTPGDTDVTLEVNGQSRAYVLHVPESYDSNSPSPLVIDFHGLTGNGPGQRSSSAYPAQTAADRVILAFPTGLAGPSGNAWNVGPCCVANVDDVAFARALVADVQERACIDPKRVYAVGFSMGGGLSHYLACHAADVFAAIAPAAFDLLEENVDDCVPERPITVVSFRGDADPLVTYEGGYSAVVSGMPITFLGAQATFAKWAEFNGCQGSPSAQDANGCSTYAECEEGTEVTLCTKAGGGHEAGNASIAWPVLKRHTLP